MCALLLYSECEFKILRCEILLSHKMIVTMGIKVKLKMH